MADEELQPGEPLAVAELHKRLLPYHTCRDRLGFATKAEYDVALLRLLADEQKVAVSEPALREAVRAEIRHPEPGLAFLHRFAASEVRVKAEPAGADGAETPPVDDSVGGPDEPAVSTGPRAALDARAAPSRAAGEATRQGCRKCAAPLPLVEGVRFCPSCGADQTPPTCAECGNEIDEEWSYCAFCGARVVSSNGGP